MATVTLLSPRAGSICASRESAPDRQASTVDGPVLVVITSEGRNRLKSKVVHR